MTEKPPKLKFHCPYCKQLIPYSKEEDIAGHFVFQHDMDKKTTLESLKDRFARVGLDLLEVL